MMERTLVCNKLFVYGTLKRGFGNHRCIDKATYLGTSTLSGFAMKHCGAFPAIFKVYDPVFSVHGEVYDITPEILRKCDALEGVPHHYQRIKVMLPNEVGEAWTYVQDHPPYNWRRIISGNWEGMNSPFVEVRLSLSPPSAPEKPQVSPISAFINTAF